MLTARFVLKYINVYHEVACDGNLYLVFLDFFHYYTFYAWVMSVVRFGRMIFFHMIYQVIRFPSSPSLLLLPKTKNGKQGFKNIYIVHFCVDQIVMIDEIQRFSPPLPYLCDKRCSVASPEARLCVSACACELFSCAWARISAAFTSFVVKLCKVFMVLSKDSLLQ